MSGNCSMAISVKMRGGFFRFTRAVGEQRGHLLFARDERAQPIVRRSEFALHQRERAIRAGARVVVGILLPRANRFERQQLRANVAEHNLAVAARNKVGRRVIGMNRLDALLKALQRGNLGVDVLARVIFQLRVVLVIADQRSLRGRIVESTPGRSTRRRPSANCCFQSSFAAWAVIAADIQTPIASSATSSSSSFPLIVDSRLSCVDRRWRQVGKQFANFQQNFIGPRGRQRILQQHPAA